MKKVSDATQNPSAGPGGGWFKIAEEGLNNGKWGVDTVVRLFRRSPSLSTWTHTLSVLLNITCRLPPVVSRRRRFRPALRMGIISCGSRCSPCTPPTANAGHSFTYVQTRLCNHTLLTSVSQMECAQIRVTGGTGTGKPATVSLPGAYSV
jgi:hypothetical protein